MDRRPKCANWRWLARYACSLPTKEALLNGIATTHRVRGVLIVQIIGRRAGYPIRNAFLPWHDVVPAHHLAYPRACNVASSVLWTAGRTASSIRLGLRLCASTTSRDRRSSRSVRGVEEAAQRTTPATRRAERRRVIGRFAGYRTRPRAFRCAGSKCRRAITIRQLLRGGIVRRPWGALAPRPRTATAI